MSTSSKARLTFLGTGTSQGIPMIGCDCPVCTSSDPRDRRLRASALVEYGGLTILVDAGPDFRYQMLRANVRHIDAILLTHNHKDHTGGLDDVRSFNLIEHHPVNIYCQEYVKNTLRGEIPYAFAEMLYPGAPEINVHTIDGCSPITIHSNSIEPWLEWETGKGYQRLPAKNPHDTTVDVIPIRGWHHKTKKLQVLGYRFGNIAYMTDISMLEEGELEKLQGLDAVTLGCVKIQAHHSHPSLQECLDMFEKIGAKKSYITHMSHLLPPHAKFEAMLPEGVYAAYDGLVIE